MVLFNYQESSTLELVFNDETNELSGPDDIIIEETLVRKLKDMNALFRDASGVDGDTPLYYMYNDIYRKEHEALFKNKGIKYEYTLLRPLVINGECVKAHGHVHGISPLTKTNYLEVYEVLGGKGYFELFRFIADKCEVVLVEVKQGDFVVIPPGYYHLSINTGDIPFNFGDLIVKDPQSEYGLLKDYFGAPLFCLKDDCGNISFELNKHYQDKTISIQMVTADEVPWQIPLAKVPLYAHFVAHPAYFDFIR